MKLGLLVVVGGGRIAGCMCIGAMKQSFDDYYELSYKFTVYGFGEVE